MLLCVGCEGVVHVLACQVDADVGHPQQWPVDVDQAVRETARPALAQHTRRQTCLRAGPA